VEFTDPGMDLLTKAAPGHASAVRSAVFDALTAAQVTQLASIGEAVIASLTHAGEEDTYPSALAWHRR
jgi:hypothetical protein